MIFYTCPGYLQVFQSSYKKWRGWAQRPNIFRPQGQLTPYSKIRSGQNFELVQDFMHVLVTCKYEKDWIKNNPRKGGDIIFPIVSQWGLSVAMETRVLIQSAQKPYAAFPPPQWCYTKNLIKIGQLASEIFKFKSVKFSSHKGNVTPKWVVWFGPKSNSTELLCLSWLPATLMMIWLKMNEIAWRHNFPIISIWEMFETLKGS